MAISEARGRRARHLRRHPPRHAVAHIRQVGRVRARVRACRPLWPAHHPSEGRLVVRTRVHNEPVQITRVDLHVATCACHAHAAHVVIRVRMRMCLCACA